MFAREGEWSRVTRGAAADTEKQPWDETHTITTTTTTAAAATAVVAAVVWCAASGCCHN